MKLRKTSDAELTKITALVIGTSGIGKTTSLGTLPEVGTVIASGERGTLPLRGKNYHVLPFASWVDLRDIIGAFMSQDKIKDERIKTAIVAAKVLCVDSLSECSEMCIRHIVQVERRKLTSERAGVTRDTPQSVYEEEMTLEEL